MAAENLTAVAVVVMVVLMLEGVRAGASISDAEQILRAMASEDK